MSKKPRRARRKLAAHDRGSDRHNKGAAFLAKQTRLEQRRSSQPPKTAPAPPVTEPPST